MDEKLLREIQEVEDIIIGNWKFNTLCSALELGVFEELNKGPKNLDTICRTLELPEPSAKKLLIACCALDLLSVENGVYRNNSKASNLLIKNKRGFMGDLALHIRDIGPLWDKLSDAVKENSNRWKQVTGSEKSHFETMYQDPERLEKFLLTMHFFNEEVAEVVSAHFDFSTRKSMLDIGGATGVFSHIITKNHDHMNAAIFDLPVVCDITDKWIRENYRQEDKIKTHRGSFLEDSLPQGYDVHYLGWILHDWAPETQDHILEKCFKALKPGGVLLATENLIHEQENGPVFTSLLSLTMLVSTDGGGESTGHQYMERLKKIGFTNVRIQTIPSMRSLLIAEKPV